MIISNAPFMAGLNCETMTAERRMGRVLVQGGTFLSLFFTNMSH